MEAPGHTGCGRFPTAGNWTVSPPITRSISSARPFCLAALASGQQVVAVGRWLNAPGAPGGWLGCRAGSGSYFSTSASSGWGALDIAGSEFQFVTANPTELLNSLSSPHNLHLPLLNGPSGVSITQWCVQATTSSSFSWLAWMGLRPGRPNPEPS